MAEVIRFPGIEIDPKDAPRRADGTPVLHCDGRMHVFASVPGRCECGERLWKPEKPYDYLGKEQE